MRGQILGVDTRTGEGQLAGEDGRRYAFRPDDWAHRGEPAIGLEVDFHASEGRALSIFPVPAAFPAPLVPDEREFAGVRWWSRAELAASWPDRFEPHLLRALDALAL